MKTLICAFVLLFASGCAVPKGMVKIPGGTFHMGTDMVDEELEALNLGLPEPWFVDEHPFHPVKLKNFFLDSHEVTNADYQAYVDANPKIPAPDDWARRNHPQGKANHPVVYVSWHHARHYCQWTGARLPSEAEWEAAARGDDNRIYPWGNTFNLNKANVSTGPFDRGRTRAVGTTPEGNGPYGNQDLIGNVWEWVDADYLAYDGNEDQVEGFSQNFKVMRGLSFEAVGHFMPRDYAKVIGISSRASFRGYDHSTAKLRDVGFRCAAPRASTGD
jgi:iron(II)-dependent oxidoreductase